MGIETRESGAHNLGRMEKNIAGEKAGNSKLFRQVCADIRGKRGGNRYPARRTTFLEPDVTEEGLFA